jgi:four helix bundle protein
MTSQPSILKQRSFEYSLSIVKCYKRLSGESKEYVLSRQLLRAGTSVGANICESKNAESKADYIHKLGIAQKECAESIYWLELLFQSEFIESEEFRRHHDLALQLLKMIRSSILTARQNLQRKA